MNQSQTHLATSLAYSAVIRERECCLCMLFSVRSVSIEIKTVTCMLCGVCVLCTIISCCLVHRRPVHYRGILVWRGGDGGEFNLAWTGSVSGAQKCETYTTSMIHTDIKTLLDVFAAKVDIVCVDASRRVGVSKNRASSAKPSIAHLQYTTEHMVYAYSY